MITNKQKVKLISLLGKLIGNIEYSMRIQLFVDKTPEERLIAKEKMGIANKNAGAYLFSLMAKPGHRRVAYKCQKCSTVSWSEVENKCSCRAPTIRIVIESKDKPFPPKRKD